MKTYDEKVAALIKETEKSRDSFIFSVSDFHNMVLGPRNPDNVMTAALTFYTLMTLEFLKLMKDFNTYYQGRKVVANSYTDNLLKISDELEKMLDLPPEPGFLNADNGKAE